MEDMTSNEKWRRVVMDGLSNDAVTPTLVKKVLGFCEE